MPSIESEQRGLAYLYQMRSVAPEPELIDLVYQLELRRSICVWMGQHIETVNAHLADLGRPVRPVFIPGSSAQSPSLRYRSPTALASMAFVIFRRIRSLSWSMSVGSCRRIGWPWWPMSMPMPISVCRAIRASLSRCWLISRGA